MFPCRCVYNVHCEYCRNPLGHKVYCVSLFRLWKDVTYNLKRKDVEEATKYKRVLEQRQREEAQHRLETGAKIQHKV